MSKREELIQLALLACIALMVIVPILLAPAMRG